MAKPAGQIGLGLEPAGAGGVLEGEVVQVTFENETTGFRVIRVQADGRSQPDTVVGVFPATPPGTRVRATGKRVSDRRFGEQFKADTLLPLAPKTLDGLRRYLGSGLVPGIGAAYAKRIVEAFGEQTLEILDHAPERLREVAGIGKGRAKSICDAWSLHRDVGAIMVFLQTHGASPSLAMRIYKRFGADAMHIVSKSPYRLALDVWGVGFKTADAIARSIGVAADAPERAQAGVLHLLHEVSSSGHVFTERGELEEQAAEMLSCGTDAVHEAIDVLEQAGRVRLERLHDEQSVVYTPELHDAERRVADRLAVLLAGHHPLAEATHAMADFERRTGLTLADTQRHAVARAASSKVLVITGGPGTGKTTIVQAILALFDAARIRVALSAPTGRAAKRLSETTGREATTLHRLLEYDPRRDAFKRDREEPLEAGAVIVDEASMVPLELADALLQAIDDDARLVLVGDVDQLPSVGPGAVLRDIITSGAIPTVRLVEIFRQAEGSTIVTNAHRIHAGEPPVGARTKDEQFYVIERTTPDSAIELIKEVVTRRIPRSFGLDPLKDVQVLTPMQRGPTGAIALNEMLQAELNPPRQGLLEVRRGARVLRSGDKVMQLRNDYEKDVFNGDIGRIEAVDPTDRTLVVRFDERDVSYREIDLDQLTLAYATSIHKSQGSEYPAVVVPILTGHYVMLSRNLIYTAVTRGKRLVVLVADPRAMHIALGETRREERRTHLAQRLRDRTKKN